MTLTVEAVLSLAPDQASSAAGRKLASVASWASLGCDDGALWGECKGSGAQPYQTRVDMSSLTYKCSCPSRKFPCKHALGLMLLSSAGTVAAGERPAWVREWFERRDSAAQAKPAAAAKAAAANSTPEVAAASAAAAAKRAQARAERVAAGLEELELWLGDLVRLGIAHWQREPAKFWEARAARLVDAQAPGVARRVRAFAGIAASGADWNERLLDAFGSLFLLREAYARLDTLPEPLRADVRRHIGWTTTQAEILASATDVIDDRWTVVGTRTDDDDRIVVHRAWLHAERARRFALVLQFVAPGQRLGTALMPGTTIAGTLAFVPSAYPLRAVLAEPGERYAIEAAATPPPGGLAADVLDAFARAAAADPWIEAIPAALALARIAHDRSGWYVCDAAGEGLALAEGRVDPWILEALCGDRPATLAGEYDGMCFTPVALWHDGRHVALA